MKIFGCLEMMFRDERQEEGRVEIESTVPHHTIIQSLNTHTHTGCVFVFIRIFARKLSVSPSH